MELLVFDRALVNFFLCCFARIHRREKELEGGVLEGSANLRNVDFEWHFYGGALVSGCLGFHCCPAMLLLGLQAAHLEQESLKFKQHVAIIFLNGCITGVYLGVELFNQRTISIFQEFFKVTMHYLE